MQLSQHLELSQFDQFSQLSKNISDGWQRPQNPAWILRFSAFKRDLAPIATPYGDDLVHQRAGPRLKKRNMNMKKDIHPEYKETQVTCGCGEKFLTRSTVASGSIYVEVCSVCHPFYTGKQRILDTGGRVAKFEERFGKNK